MTFRTIVNRFAAVALMGIALLSASAQASAAGSIGMELNRLQQVDAACRIIIVFTNGLAVPIQTLEVETALFRPDGVAERFLLLKSQPLAPGKIRVHQYDLPGTQCASIGSVLVNDVVGCEGEGLDPATCLADLSVSSRETARLYTGTETTGSIEPAPAQVSLPPQN